MDFENKTRFGSATNVNRSRTVKDEGPPITKPTSVAMTSRRSPRLSTRRSRYSGLIRSPEFRHALVRVSLVTTSLLCVSARLLRVQKLSPLVPEGKSPDLSPSSPCPQARCQLLIFGEGATNSIPDGDLFEDVHHARRDDDPAGCRHEHPRDAGKLRGTGSRSPILHFDSAEPREGSAAFRRARFSSGEGDNRDLFDAWLMPDVAMNIPETLASSRTKPASTSGASAAACNRDAWRPSRSSGSRATTKNSRRSTPTRPRCSTRRSSS